MSENKINRIKEYCKENIKENKKDKLQFIIYNLNYLLINIIISVKGMGISYIRICAGVQIQCWLARHRFYSHIQKNKKED